jgi:spermidine/putrescine transport system substrate-binding protein
MIFTRRKFVRLAATAVATTAATRLSGCTSSSNSSTGSNSGTLRVLSWPGYDEPDVVEEFQDQHKVKLEFKTYLGGEQMLQFFSQVPRGTFDCIIVDAEYIQKLLALNAIDPLNPADYPELKNYHSSYQNFPFYYQDNNLLALAVRFGFDSLCYNKQHFSQEDIQSWNILFRNDLRGKIALFDWYLPDMGIASLANFPEQENPYDITDDQLQQIRSWLLKLKPNVGLITNNI